MIRVAGIHLRIDIANQSRTELRKKRHDGIQPFLQMLFRKHKPGERLRIGSSLRIARHNLRRRLTADLTDLIFDLAAAGAERAVQRHVKTAQFGAESVERGGNGALRGIQTFAKFGRHQARRNGRLERLIACEKAGKIQAVASHPFGCALVENGEAGARKSHRLPAKQLIINNL